MKITLGFFIIISMFLISGCTSVRLYGSCASTDEEVNKVSFEERDIVSPSSQRKTKVVVYRNSCNDACWFPVSVRETNIDQVRGDDR